MSPDGQRLATVSSDKNDLTAAAVLPGPPRSLLSFNPRQEASR
jgi:hypothetical protein